MHYVRIVVRGHVQGVGYRWFILTAARALGLTGVVRNLDDGRVEIEAEGERDVLYDLLQRAHQGPANARVEHVDAQWSEHPSRFQEFRIL